MPLTGQPEFEIGDIPTVAQLNAWMDTITAKFNAAISTDDIRWPMKAGGPINLNGHGISGIPVLRGQYNLAERRPWVTVRMIFDEVEARGGGTVVLPGNTVQLASTGQDGVTGIRVGSNTRLIGHGMSSDLDSLVAKGKEMFKGAGCPECHGEGGRGDGPSASRLTSGGRPTRPADLTRRPFKGGDQPEEIYRVLAGGLDGTPMPSYRDALEEEEIWSLAVYVTRLAKPGGEPVLTDDERIGREVEEKHQPMRRR